MAGILEKIAKDKQQKERKTDQIPVAHSCESSYHQHRMMIDDPTIIIKTIGTMIILDATTRM
jgi:hypothetical protein